MASHDPSSWCKFDAACTPSSIGTRLSTAAGVFFAAEGTTDFRATGTDVDIGDAAVRTIVGQEIFSGCGTSR